MRKIKALQFSIANSKGGVTQYTLNNWKYINHEKFQFDFVTFASKLDFQEQLELSGGKIYYVKNRAEEDLILFENEIFEILKNNYDVIHLHTNYWKTLNMERIAQKAGIPKIIIHAHNTGVFDEKGREKKIKQHEMIKSEINEKIATDFWACSNVAAEFLYGDRIPKEKIKIMNNAIDVDKFKFNFPARENIRNKFGWKDKFVVGHVGRFSYQKNHEFLIQVINEISPYIPNLQVILIGKGELESKVKRQVEELGLSKIVYFAGTMDDPEDWYSTMDLFLLPSRFEGLPIVAIEAQAAGLTCLISDRITEEVMINENLFMLPLDVRLWAKKIYECHQNSYREENGIINLKKEGYDIAKQIKVIENEYLSGGIIYSYITVAGIGACA